MKLNFNLIGFLYVIITGGISYIFSIPDIVKAFLALPSFLIIPIIIGELILILVRKLLSISDTKRDSYDLILEWSLGTIYLIVMAYFLNYINIFNIRDYTLFIILLMFFSVVYNNLNSSKQRVTNKYNGMIFFFFSFFIGIIAFLFVNHFSPYPYEAGGDSIDHKYFSVEGLLNGFFYFHPSYLLSMHILSIIIIQIFNLSNSPYTLFWFGRLLLYLTYSLGLYLFSFNLSKKNSISLLTVIMGIFIVHNFSGLIFLNDFSPKAFILILFPFLLFYIHSKANDYLYEEDFSSKKIVSTIPSLLILFSLFVLLLYYTYNPSSSFSFVDYIGLIFLPFLVLIILMIRYLFKSKFEKLLVLDILPILFILPLFHIPIGSIGAFFILLYFTVLISIKKLLNLYKIILYFIIFLVLTFFVLQILKIIEFPSLLVSYYDVFSPTMDGFNNIIRTLKDLYIIPIFLFSFLGVAFTFYFKENRNFPSLLIFTSTLLILLMPIGSIWRIIVLLNPVIIYFASYGLVEISLKILNKNLFTKVSFMILLFLVIANSMDIINEVVAEKGVFSYAIGEEIYSPGDFLISNVSKNTLILQNEHNKNIFRIGYYSGLITYTPLQKEEPPKCISEIFIATKSDTAYNNIKNLSKNIDVDCRYYIGGVSSYQYNQRRYKIEKLIEKRISNKINYIIILDKISLLNLPKQSADKFYDQRYFTPIYINEKYDVYIFGVNPEPDVPFELQNATIT